MSAKTLVLVPLLAAGLTTAAFSQNEAPKVPFQKYTLPNGLQVILHVDRKLPMVHVNLWYHVGSKNERIGRSGFAHLFEHMMFQGSQNLGKMEFIRLVQQNGGVLNGSTRFDFTNYFELLPSNKLETALWAEADRMKGLAITGENLKNQQDVVINEVKTAVLNQPYGGFPWLWMPQYANSNWYNSHNFYGELKDIEAATLTEVQAFFKTYYAPNNAALAIVGDFDPGEATAMIAKYFAAIAPAELPPPPDLSEPRQKEEKTATRKDPLANRPALAFSYHMPPRNSPEYFAMGLLDQMLVQGDDSLLYRELVKKHGFTGEVSGAINELGNMFDYDGPMLWTAALFHDATVQPEQILSAVDTVIESLRAKPVDQSLVDRSITKMRSSLYDTLTQFGGFGRADLLACYALFDDAPSRIDSLESEFRKVTPQLVESTAREYLRRTNRTVLLIDPGTASPDDANGAPEEESK